MTWNFLRSLFFTDIYKVFDIGELQIMYTIKLLIHKHSMLFKRDDFARLDVYPISSLLNSLG